jgi:hypothetical protein
MSDCVSRILLGGEFFFVFLPMHAAFYMILAVDLIGLLNDVSDFRKDTPLLPETARSFLTLFYLECTLFVWLTDFIGMTQDYKLVFWRKAFLLCSVFVVYAIIRTELLQKRRIGAVMMEYIDKFFSCFESYRAIVLRLGKYTKKLSYGMVLRIWGVCAGISLYMSGTQQWDWWPFIGLVLLLLAYFFFLSTSYFSCRRFLLCLLINGTVSGCLLAFYVSRALHAVSVDRSEVFAYILYTLAIVFAWCSASLVADDAPAKLALSIVNTLLTIAAILINIAAVYTATFMKELAVGSIYANSPFDAYFMLLFNLAELPFVAAGYLALLTKDMQIYWKKQQKEKSEKRKEEYKKFCQEHSQT